MSYPKCPINCAAFRQVLADKDEMVARNALLRHRDDLPVDRLPAHKKLEDLQKRNRVLTNLISNLRMAIESSDLEMIRKHNMLRWIDEAGE